MNQYFGSVTDQLERILLKFVENSNQVSSTNKSEELEQVFDRISNVLVKNQSQVISTIDKFSQSTAHIMVSLFEKHFEFIHYTFLTLFATFLVMVGAFASIQSIPYTALPPTKLHPLFDPSDFDLDQDCQIVYTDKKNKKKSALSHLHLDEKHAILLPIQSGIALMILYFIITKLHVQWKNILLKGLGFLMVMISIPAGYFVYNYICSTTIRYVAHFTSWNTLRISPRMRVTISDDNEDINKNGWFIQNFQHRDALTNELVFNDVIEKLDKDDYNLRELYTRELTKPKDVKSVRQILNIYTSNSAILSLIVALSLSSCYYFVPNDWIIRNVISVNLAIWSISQSNLKNLKSATLILFALFLYDIYFVFGTNVMVTVASNLDLPVKLSMPTKFNISQSKFEFSILGLGDIVLPGIFISLCYKYDIWKWHYENNDTEFHLLNWSYIGKYFTTSLISYFLGLSTCMFAHTKYKTAQPALLYIVPFLLVSTILLAWSQSDLSQFWTFQYDVIELGENILRDPDDINIDDIKEFPVTYSDFFQSPYIENDDDEEDYTNNDAIIDYVSDDDLESDTDSDISNNNDCQLPVPEYKPTDILGLLDEASNLSDADDADYILDENDLDMQSDTETVILDVDQ